MPDLRIAITGAPGVGKTTLALSLGDKLGLPVLPETARALCHQKGYQSPVEIVDQEEFKLQVLEEQIKAENSHSSLVADRCAIDCWVLWQRWQMCTAMTFDSERYYETCKQQARKYTHVIYVPPLFTAPEDNFRWTEPDYVKQVDRLTRLTLYDWELLGKTLTVTQLDEQARLAEVLEWIAN